MREVSHLRPAVPCESVDSNVASACPAFGLAVVSAVPSAISSTVHLLGDEAVIETDVCPKRGPNPRAGVEDYWRKLPTLGRHCSFCLSLKPSDALELLERPEFALEGKGEVRQLCRLEEGAAEHRPIAPVAMYHFSEDEKAELSALLASRAEAK
jgi:hypothetical protein